MGSYDNQLPGSMIGAIGTAINLQSDGSNTDGAVPVFEYIQANTVPRTIIAAGQRSANITSSLIANPCANGGIFWLDKTDAAPGSASLTVVIVVQAQSHTTGRFVTIGKGGTRSSSGVSQLTIFPGITESSGTVTRVNAVLPRNFQVYVSLSAGATSKDANFSVGMAFLK